jgi:hypothetical protein
LTQPWASLVALGAKQLETRNWLTPYRGPLAIHAAKTMPREVIEWVLGCWHAREALRAAGYASLRTLPLGAIVAAGELVECCPIRVGGVVETARGVRVPLSDQEQAFGDFAAGRVAWRLADMRRVEPPVPCRGALGLWHMEADTYQQVLQALERGPAVPGRA